MRPELAHAILEAARAIRACAEAGEHPGAALAAVQVAYDRCGAQVCHGHADRDWRDRLAGVLGALRSACRDYAEVALPCELHRLRKLVQIAEVVLQSEEVCA